MSLTLGLRRFRPDVIHIDSEPWAVVFWQAMLCRRLFAPQARVVAMVKKNTYRRYPGLRGRLKRWVAATGIDRVDRFISASEMTARLYQREFGVERNRLTIATHIGVDTDAFRPAPGSLERRDDVVVGYCGRFAVEKGVTDLLEAVAICRSRAELDVRLCLLGAGPLHGELASYALRRGWLDVLPPLPNHRVPEFLSAIDVFALPSRVLPDHEEHDAHALTEALAAGVPTIGTRSGIIPELLGDGSGLRVDPENPRELSESLGRLFTSPKRHADLAERGRAKAIRCFALAEVARERVSIYRSVLVDV
jgi:glycosyltransferase involved in cell wall biosynthesis